MRFMPRISHRGGRRRGGDGGRTSRDVRGVPRLRAADPEVPDSVAGAPFRPTCAVVTVRARRRSRREPRALWPRPRSGRAASTGATTRRWTRPSRSRPGFRRRGSGRSRCGRLCRRFGAGSTRGRGLPSAAWLESVSSRRWPRRSPGVGPESRLECPLADREPCRVSLQRQGVPSRAYRSTERARFGRSTAPGSASVVIRSAGSRPRSGSALGSGHGRPGPSDTRWGSLQTKGHSREFSVVSRRGWPSSSGTW